MFNLEISSTVRCRECNTLFLAEEIFQENTCPVCGCLLTDENTDVEEGSDLK